MLVQWHRRDVTQVTHIQLLLTRFKSKHLLYFVVLVHTLIVFWACPCLSPQLVGHRWFTRLKSVIIPTCLQVEPEVKWMFYQQEKCSVSSIWQFHSE